jgi:transcriptional regulator of acetoin/glycerol metabolism
MLLEADTLDSVLGNVTSDIVAITGAAGVWVGWLSDGKSVAHPMNTLPPGALAAFRKIKKEGSPHQWTPLREEHLREMGLLGTGYAKSGAFCCVPSFSRPDAELFIITLDSQAEPRALTTVAQGGRFFWEQFTANLARLDAVQAESTPFFARCSDGRDLRQVAISFANAPDAGVILLEGESGTGKTTLARWIHAHFDPPRRRGIVEHKCDPTDNVDLFKNKILGVRKGEFTGADRDRPGFVERCEDGTLFLDNILKLDRRSQEVLLGVLERRARYFSVARKAEVPVKCRFILATAEDVQVLERERDFSPDLANRIKPGRIPLRPVRQYDDTDLAAVLEHLWKVVW